MLPSSSSALDVADVGCSDTLPDGTIGRFHRLGDAIVGGDKYQHPFHPEVWIFRGLTIVGETYDPAKHQPHFRPKPHRTC